MQDDGMYGEHVDPQYNVALTPSSGDGGGVNRATLLVFDNGETNLNK